MPVQGWHPRTYQGWPSLKSTSGHQRLPIFHQQIPTSPALVDFHHLIEGRLPGDQRPLSWQMTHDRRALQISRGQGSDPRRPWVVPGKDLHKLQGKYRWAWTPDPWENLRLLGGGGRQVVGLVCFLHWALTCCPYAYCRKLPAVISSIHLQVGVCNRSVTDWLSPLDLQLVRKCGLGRYKRV